MPEMLIPNNFNSDSVIALNTAHILLAYMIYPENSAKNHAAREVFIQASNQQIIKHVKNAKKESVAKYASFAPDIETAYDRVVNKKVKSNLILAKDSEDFLLSINAQDEISKFGDPEIQRDWETVAFIARTLIRMSQYHPNLPGGVSIQKACYFLEECIKQRLLPKATQIRSNKRDMKKAWGKYKSVAHLIVPYYQMLSQPESDLSIYTQNGVQKFLVLAVSLQQALLSMKTTHGNKDKILKRAELWNLPKWFDIHAVPIKADEFSENQKKILMNYQYGS